MADPESSHGYDSNIFLIPLNSVSESFDSTHLMTHYDFTRLDSNQLTIQNGFMKFDSNRLMTKKNFQNFDPNQLTTKKFPNLDSNQLMTQ